MAEAEKIKLESLDIAEKKREQLKELFPEAFAEDKIDFDQLKRVLGEWVEPAKERFGLNWPGKAECMKIIQQPSVATLKPVREESVNFDDTENLFIEGDNLEVLKLLQKSYFGKVKMIYIDPPYNTGKEFIYPDKFAETLDTYLEYTGQKDAKGHKFSTNSDTAGRYHSNWLNMMYPRLYLAKNLLCEDGVIFISIDDHEQANLKALCDQIFGEECFIADINVVNNLKGRNDKKYIATANERLLMYVKSDAFEEYGLDLPEGKIEEYKYEDEKGKHRLIELRKRGGADTRAERPNMYYPIYVDPKTGNVSLEKTSTFSIEALPKKSDGVDGRWRWGLETTKGRLALLKGQQVNGSDRYNIYEKSYLESDGEIKRLKPKSVLGGADYSTDGATKSYRALMPEADFDNPKPVPMIEDLVTYATSPDSEAICLDFFAGSGTLAHAVMGRNAKDSGNRRFICIQLPEPTDEKDKAYKANYKTIADLSKERIRRAAKKIEEEKNGQMDFNGGGQLDLGFKVFKLDRSNFKVWEGDVEKVENLEQQLFDHVDHISDASSPEDILYELLLKSGFSLSTQVKKLHLAGKDVFSIAEGALLICLDKNLTQKVIDEIANANPLQVICLDDGFKGNDQLKANAVQTFKARKARAQKDKDHEIIFRTV